MLGFIMAVLAGVSAMITEFQKFFGSRAGQMILAFVIYLTSIGMIEKGPRDIGEKIAFMAIGSILQSMVANRDN